MINTYFINLDRSKDRRAHMEKTFKNITRIPAFDGDILDNYENIKLPLKCWQNKYQLACSLSHIKAIIEAYQNNDEGAIISEDDIDNQFKNKWCKNINTIIKDAPDNTECISLFCSSVNRLQYFITLSEDYSPWINHNWSTCCYYINRSGMKKILDMFYKDGIIDLSIRLLNYVADDGVIYNNIITYNYTKPLFINTQFNTTIQFKPSLEKKLYDFIHSYFESI
tara:strand:- start:185 stop:856 length:672 start_codon:yes stop_codon:yes gene_type:complete